MLDHHNIANFEIQIDVGRIIKAIPRNKDSSLDIYSDRVNTLSITNNPYYLFVLVFHQQIFL